MTNTSCVCQVYLFFSAHLDNKQKSFVPKENLRHVTIRDFKNKKIHIYSFGKYSIELTYLHTHTFAEIILR